MPVDGNQPPLTSGSMAADGDDTRDGGRDDISRRGYLSGVKIIGAGGGIAALAGCAGDGESDTGDGGGGTTTSPGTTTEGGATTTRTTAPGDLEMVSFSFVPSAATAPIWLADEYGYFEERGIQTEGTTSVSASQATAQLATGQLDLTVGGAGASTFNAIAEGIPISFSCDEASSTPGLPMANKFYIRQGLHEEGMTLDDVEPPVTFAIVAPASVADYMFARTLSIHDNLSWDTIEVETMPFPQMMSAMDSGAIDIAQQIDPLGPIMEQNIGAQFIEYSHRPSPGLQISGIIVGGPFVNQRRAVARKWHEAYILGIRKFYELGGIQNDEVASITAEALDQDVSSLKMSIPYLPNKNGYLQEDSIMDQQDYHACQGYTEQQASRDDVIARDLLDEALDEIGRVPESEERVGEDVFDEMQAAAPITWAEFGGHRTPSTFPNDEVCGQPLS